MLMDDFEDEQNVVREYHISKEPCHYSTNGPMKFVDELLGGPNANCCQNFCMDKQLFYKPCDILQSKGFLRHTSKIKIEEQLAIFMFTIGHDQRTRAVQERFQYSGETISRHFNNVLNAIVALSLDYFLPLESCTPQEVLNDPKFHPYFKDCVGVVDGVHIPVMVGVDEQGPFRNRKGIFSQNVMAACSFDLQFQYVLAGWEGSATDSGVLSAALTRRNKLHVPEGKYYLVDSEYANMPGFIPPYSSIHGQLSEYTGDHHAQNAEELFNHRHSLLRNAINRTFEVWKTRFPILTSAPPYPLQTQVKLVVATCILHNYIRKEKRNDWLFSTYEQDNGCHSDTQVKAEPTIQIETPGFDVPYEGVDSEMASELRDAIASEMWNDYMHDISSAQE